jgi:hypothetical protein
MKIQFQLQQVHTVELHGPSPYFQANVSSPQRSINSLHGTQLLCHKNTATEPA